MAGHSAVSRSLLPSMRSTLSNILGLPRGVIFSSWNSMKALKKISPWIFPHCCPFSIATLIQYFSTKYDTKCRVTQICPQITAQKVQGHEPLTMCEHFFPLQNVGIKPSQFPPMLLSRYYMNVLSVLYASLVLKELLCTLHRIFDCK